MRAPTTKEKGDLLEDIITGICAGLRGSTVTRNAEIEGRHSRAKRDVDVLIEGRINAFVVRIAVEAKNYQERVGVSKIEALHAKLEDICEVPATVPSLTKASTVTGLGVASCN